MLLTIMIFIFKIFKLYMHLVGFDLIAISYIALLVKLQLEYIYIYIYIFQKNLFGLKKRKAYTYSYI